MPLSMHAATDEPIQPSPRGGGARVTEFRGNGDRGLLGHEPFENLADPLGCHAKLAIKRPSACIASDDSRMSAVPSWVLELFIDGVPLQKIQLD
jgi:hypothetical protein